MTDKEAYDYIVIGAGSAGCVLANRLSADPKRSVLLIEAGGRDRHPLVQLPMLMGKLMHSRIYNWSYETEPEPELGNRRIYWPRGKALGGSSTINGMIYVRGNRHDYDRWAQMGLPGWSYERSCPIFASRKVTCSGATLFMGRRGRSRFAARGARTRCSTCSSKPAGRRDIRSTMISTARNRKASAAMISPFATASDAARRRRSCARSSIGRTSPSRRMPSRTGSSSRTTGPLRWTSQRAAETRRVRAGREIVLCAGAVNSPQVLMLSGIGDADELGAHGIEVVHHLPGVGKNLHDHVDVCVVYQINKPITLHSDLRIDRLTASVVQGFLFGEGVATTFPYEGGAFLKSRPGLDAPDIQAHFMPALEKTANLHWPKLFGARKSKTTTASPSASGRSTRKVAERSPCVPRSRTSRPEFSPII